MPKRRPRWVVLSISVTVILAMTGCMVGPNYHPPDVSGYTKQSWQVLESLDSAGAPTVAPRSPKPDNTENGASAQ